jgi:hypothetical protein
MCRQLPQSLLDLRIFDRISLRFRQPFGFKAPFHFEHVLLTEPARLNERFHLGDRGEVIALARQTVDRINGFGDQVLRVSREQLDEAGRVNLRIAGLDRRVVPDQGFRRLRRHSHNF